jgi:hypothetical protein
MIFRHISSFGNVVWCWLSRTELHKVLFRGSHVLLLPITCYGIFFLQSFNPSLQMVNKFDVKINNQAFSTIYPLIMGLNVPSLVLDTLIENNPK